jgi:molecular chaperone GrpE
VEADVDVEALQAELAEANEKFIRAHAEMENVRRRAENEVTKARKFAIENFASELLPVKDSLELASAVEIAEDNADALEKMREGLELTLKMLDKAFEKFNIEELNPAAGDRLDPEAHQAMGTMESTEVEPNCVVNVVQKGYRLNDRLLRPAMVMVAKKSA